MSFLSCAIFVAFVVTKCTAGFLPAHGHPLSVGAHCAKSDECAGVAICGGEQICECPAPLYRPIGGECQPFNAWGNLDLLKVPFPLPAAPIPAPVALPKIIPRAPLPAFNRFVGGPAFAPAPAPNVFPDFAAPYLQHHFAASRFAFPYANMLPGFAPAPAAPLPAFAPAPLSAFAPAPLPAFAPAPLPAFAPAPLPAFAPAPLPIGPAPFPAPAFQASGCAAGLVVKAGVCAPVVIPVDQSLPGEPCNMGQECTGGSVCAPGGLCLCPPELVHIGDSCVLPPPPQPPVGPTPTFAAPAPFNVAPAPWLAAPAPIYSAPAPFAPAIAPAIAAPAVIKAPLHFAGPAAVGNPCVASTQCVAGAQCSLGACHCGSGYFAQGTSCVKRRL